MTKSGFSYMKLIGVGAVMAISLISSMRSSTAKSQPPDANLANEQRVITRYADELIAYENQAAALGKRAALANTDIDPLQRKSEDLKGRLSEVQNAAREVIRKLKAANEWDDADARLAARITDARLKSYVEQDSFKQDLENAANSLTSQANEISAPLEKLRKRVARQDGRAFEAQIVHAAYSASVPFTSGSLGCRIGRLGLKIVIGVGGSPSKEQVHRVFNRCHPDGTVNPF
jgi:hypothetical protein